MKFVYHIRNRSRGAIVPVLLFLIILYFGVSFLEGKRGIYAWRNLNQQNLAAVQKLNKLKETKIYLEKSVLGLRQKSLDLDLLDEQARRSLGFISKNEYVLLNLDKLQ